MVGVETAGALKNIIAVGAGALHGLGYGDNAKAAVITRGLAEITRLGVKLGADPHLQWLVWCRRFDCHRYFCPFS